MDIFKQFIIAQRCIVGQKNYLRFLFRLLVELKGILGYITGRRKRFRSHKVNILLIRINSRVVLAMSVLTYQQL